MHKILLVEDAKEVYQIVSQSLGPDTTLEWKEDFKSGQEALKEGSYDLVLLDIELPDGNGLQLCSTVQKENPQTPIFILTSHDDLSEKVMGFSVGADDYITKPFEPLELKARIEAKLKKLDFFKQNADQIDLDNIRIDKSTQAVEVNVEGEFKPIELTALEFKLLLYFAKQPDAVISRDTILDDIWGQDVHVYSRSVDTHVSKLRKKLGPVKDIIQSVHGAGYKFTPGHASR